ncbi:MAG: flippase [Steroidobacteraceae bacterium]
MTDAVSETPDSGSSRVVARNAMIMMLAQVLGMPLSMLVNVAIGRMLGPAEYGEYYVLTTYATLAFLFVDWGHAAVLPARIANDRSKAGNYLGSTLLWTFGSSIVITGLLVMILFARGENGPYLLTMALVCLGQALTVVVKNGGDAVRGFERTDVAAFSQVGGQVMLALLVIPTLLLGGRLNAVLIATAISFAVVLIFVWRSFKPTGIGKLSVNLATNKDLLQQGTAFLMLNLILYLQPTIDAHYLAKYASEEAIGWHAAARKLINPLVFPASALMAALYPTLCRLWTQDQGEYKSTARGALRASIIITVPLALGCALFAEIGILLFSKEAYGPAQDNLRILAVYVFLLYVTMIMGTCLNAAGKQRAWTGVQFLCVIMTLIIDPILVPWFQEHKNNGGLGVNLAGVTNETMMMIAAFLLLPRGVIDRTVARTLGLALVAGLAMAAVAWVLSGITPFVAAPIALAAYAGTLYAIGGVEKEQLQMLRSMKRKG